MPTRREYDESFAALRLPLMVAGEATPAGGPSEIMIVQRRVKGDLSIRGVNQAISLPLKWNGHALLAQFQR